MRKLISIVLVLVATVGYAQHNHSVSLLCAPSLYYTSYGVAYVQTTKQIKIYSDFKYSDYSGIYDQKYRHYTAHVGYVFEIIDLLDAYTAVGIHQENITWSNELGNHKQILDSFNIATGFLIRNKNRRLGWQQGFEIDCVNGIGVAVVMGLIINI